MQRLSDFVLTHRLLVLLIWLAVSVAGAVTAPRTVEALTYSSDLPGQPAYETNVEIQRLYGGGGVVDPLVLTTTAAEGTDLSTRAGIAEFSQAAEEIAASAPGTRVVTPANADADALVSADGTQAVALLYPRVVPGPAPYAQALPGILQAAEQTQVAGSPTQVTSAGLMEEGGEGGGDRGVIVEVLLGGLGALVVLVLVFTSLLAGLPLLVAAVSILGTFLALLGLTAVTDVSFVVQYLVALIGLGVAIDYSLLIVMRWREERSAGVDNDTATRTALLTAGRAVVFSGVTVAISLAALVAVPLPFLRSIGLGGLLIPLLSVATSLTLVPVILHTIGPRLEWPRRRAHDPTSKRWAAVSGWVVRRRWPVVIGTTVLLAAMAAPALTLRLGTPEAASYGSDSPPAAATSAIVASGLTPALLRPVEVLTTPDAAASLAEQLTETDGVASATRVDDPQWSADGTTLLQVYLAEDPATSSAGEALQDVRDLVATQGARAGGTPAEDADFVSAVYGNAPIVVTLIVVVTFVLLARALRSLWLPVKALALNVLSLGAAFGLTVLIWQHGYGTDILFGLDATGVLVIWVPVAAFAFLFGLSMDYEVFILSRMREAFDAHGDTPRSVVEGISQTGRLVTSAALILFLAFIALSTVPAADVKILATTLALGIAIDALIVRSLLTPALVALLGRHSWTLPRSLAVLLRVRSHVSAPRR